MSRLRILHVIPSVAVRHGGPSRALASMERALARHADVTTLTTDDDGPRGRVALPPATSEAGTRRVYARKWTDFYKVAPGAASWLWRHVRDYDVVHIHALFSFTSTAAAMAARARGVPYVVRPLGTLAGYGMRQRRPRLKRATFAALESRIVRNAAAMHFTSEAERDEALSLGVPMRSAVIPLGIDAPARDRHQSADVRRPVTILFLSRLDPKKNVEGLLQAVAMLGAGPALRLLVAGDGEPGYVARLHALADSLGLGDTVYWLGHVDGDDKAAAFARSDLFVLPSFSENFGIAAVEAMLAGVPCVLSPGVAVATATAAVDAAAIAGPEPEILADALRVLIADDVRRRELGSRGQAFARQEYSTEAMGQRLMALYEAVRS